MIAPGATFIAPRRMPRTGSSPRAAIPEVSRCACTRSGRASTARLGIALMLLGMALFSLNDAIGKWLVATYASGRSC
jgi:hypothetical protein